MNEEEIERYAGEAEANYRDLAIHYRGLALDEAVRQAGSAINGDEIFHDHQYRAGKDNCAFGAEVLCREEYLDRIRQADSFEALIEITDEVSRLPETVRLGLLWSYDTAQKIGFHLSRAVNDRFYPRDVYLHNPNSGPRRGAQMLINHGFLSTEVIGTNRFVSAAIFPDALSRQAPYIIENILCVAQKRNPPLSLFN